jgi:glycyl-tRNA synthetase
MEDNSVTVRHRDSMEQERVDIGLLRQMITEKISFKNLFTKL